MLELMVLKDFLTYSVGDKITDPVSIEYVLESRYGGLPWVAATQPAGGAAPVVPTLASSVDQLGVATAEQVIAGTSGYLAITPLTLSAALDELTPGAIGAAGLDGTGSVALNNLRIRRAQFLLALEDLGAGNGNTLYNAIPANPGDPTWIAYNHDWVVEPGGPLAVFVANTFGLSSGQMTALFTAAKAK